MNTLRATVLLLMGALSVSACGNTVSASEKLRVSVLDYNDSVRWSRFERAASHLPDDRREDFVARHREEADNVRYLEYEIEEVHQVDHETARVTVRTMVTRMPSNIVDRARMTQKWEYGEDKRWRLVEAKRAKKAAKRNR